MTSTLAISAARMAVAALAMASGAQAQEVLLAPHEAFRVSAKVVDLSSSGHTIELTYTIAPGYYLYKDRFAFIVKGEGGKISSVVMPKATTKFESALGYDVSYYAREVAIQISMVVGTAPVTLVASAQGCASAGICYPPVRKNFIVPSPTRSTRG